MHLYVPRTATPRPGVLVAMHGCNGGAAEFFEQTEFRSLADRHGFVVIYPQGAKSAKDDLSNCFDVWSEEALRHGGGSDPGSIVSMVDHVVRRHDGDAARVFATGFSSGAMQTVNLLVTHPDVFRAGVSFAGVPYGWFGPPGRGDRARDAFPGYTGPAPRLMAWHGTEDDVLDVALLQQTVDQFAGLYGAGQVEGHPVEGAGHDLPHPGMAARAIGFFGLDGSG